MNLGISSSWQFDWWICFLIFLLFGWLSFWAMQFKIFKSSTMTGTWIGVGFVRCCASDGQVSVQPWSWASGVYHIWSREIWVLLRLEFLDSIWFTFVSCSLWFVYVCLLLLWMGKHLQHIGLPDHWIVLCGFFGYSYDFSLFFNHLQSCSTFYWNVLDVARSEISIILSHISICLCIPILTCGHTAAFEL